MSTEAKNAAAWIEDCLLREYTLQQVLSQKPASEVTLWRHNTFGRKIILRRCIAAPDVYQRMLGVVHPNLPQVYEAIESDGKLLVLEEYIEGALLSDQIAIIKGQTARVQQLGICLCDAVSCLHGIGIIHRDIKPENIIIEGATNTLKLIDFAASRCKRTAPAGACDTVCLGTAPYAAPEQFGVAQTDERTDIYAIGILLNILMTGQHPSQIISPGRMGRIIRRCIRVNASERFASVEKLKSALLDI